MCSSNFQRFQVTFLDSFGHLSELSALSLLCQQCIPLGFRIQAGGSIRFYRLHSTPRPNRFFWGEKCLSCWPLKPHPAHPSRFGVQGPGRAPALPSLTFLGYLYGAVTDFTCCCSSLVSWSRSWDRNWGIRTTNAFTTCRTEPEAQAECQPAVMNGNTRRRLSLWGRTGPGSNPKRSHFHGALEKDFTSSSLCGAQRQSRSILRRFTYRSHKITRTTCSWFILLSCHFYYYCMFSSVT